MPENPTGRFAVLKALFVTPFCRNSRTAALQKPCVAFSVGKVRGRLEGTEVRVVVRIGDCCGRDVEEAFESCWETIEFVAPRRYCDMTFVFEGRGGSVMLPVGARCGMTGWCMGGSSTGMGADTDGRAFREATGGDVEGYGGWTELLNRGRGLRDVALGLELSESCRG